MKNLKVRLMLENDEVIEKWSNEVENWEEIVNEESEVDWVWVEIDNEWKLLDWDELVEVLELEF